jgi:pimeloyl-ACP methyl ester carboxylesterase
MVLLHTTYTNPLRTAFLAPLWSALERPLIVPLNWLTIALAPLAWLSNLQSFLNGSLHLATRFTSFGGNQSRGDVHHAAWLAVKAWPAVVARGNLAMLEFDESTSLADIDIPVLVIGAAYDRLTKIEASNTIERKLPNGRFASVAAGHLGHWEQHARVSELIGEFAESFREPEAENLREVHAERQAKR